VADGREQSGRRIDLSFVVCTILILTPRDRPEGKLLQPSSWEAMTRNAENIEARQEPR
jgi:hypothetical protein